MKSAGLQMLYTSAPGNVIDRNIKGCSTSRLFLQQTGEPEIETGITEGPREEGQPEWDPLSPPDWGDSGFFMAGTLPCHPMQHPARPTAYVLHYFLLMFATKSGAFSTFY